MLQVMGPPFREEDLYVEHLFETISSLGFPSWPADERLAVTTYLTKLASIIKFVLPEDQEKFLLQVQNLERLPNEPLQPSAQKTRRG